jgi:hypothetical protein
MTQFLTYLIIILKLAHLMVFRADSDPKFVQANRLLNRLPPAQH